MEFLKQHGLVDVDTFAEELGVKKPTLWSYAARDADFPEGELIGRARVWRREDVEEYKVVRSKRKVGRPHGWRKQPDPEGS